VHTWAANRSRVQTRYERDDCFVRVGNDYPRGRPRRIGERGGDQRKSGLRSPEQRGVFRRREKAQVSGASPMERGNTGYAGVGLADETTADGLRDISRGETAHRAVSPRRGSVAR
jgi:hypothetical protein